ncbi:MAG TPA: tetratricopeptide repeat protein [Pirellulales bacterium]|jgi:hypothetical protein
MSQPGQYDVVILGSGAPGKLLFWSLAAFDPIATQPTSGATGEASSTIPPVEAARAKLLKQRDERYDKSHTLHEKIKSDEALEAAQKMLALERQIFGPDSDDATRSLSWIGTIHEALEQWEAAR